jgi:type II restriction/modification system DNA methylase subunit YeeA
MNKSALKTFATCARKELLKKIEAKALKIGITEDNIKKAHIESSDAIFIDGRRLSKEEKIQRDQLISRIKQNGYRQVLEEVAYTWFNRFTALRFMEVNDYLPTGVKVLSSSNQDSADPDMINEALALDLEMNKEYVYEMKLNNQTEELFKYLIIKHCNDLNKYLPFMFETIDDFTEILFPEGLLAKDSFIRQMTDIEFIPEENWQDVEIIGWLYQFYISEEKDRVFTNLKKNIKVTKETLPAATQLFTPNWIVKYLVQNSLGRIWLESYSDSSLKKDMNYYLDEAGQDEVTLEELERIRYKNVNPEEITLLDPCCGSGHILVYAFDLFYEMYFEKGYLDREIPKLILEKNLFGLDVDERAIQLASFAVLMKARGKYRRVFDQDINLNICSIQESNWITDNLIEKLSDRNNQIKDMIVQIQNTFIDAKEYGSLLHLNHLKFDIIEDRLQNFLEEQTDLIGLIEKDIMRERLPSIIKQSKMLSLNYDVVCTNPPYMGISNMSNKLKKFVQNNFENSKADLYATFIEWALLHTKQNGYCSLVTMHSWFFLSSFETMRRSLLEKSTFKSILHLGMEAFEGIIGKVVQTAAFIIQNTHIEQYTPIGIRLVDFYDARKYEKETQFFNPENKFNTIKQDDFGKIPGSPIAYWISKKEVELFESSPKIGDFYDAKGGMTSGNNELFLRYWHEVDYNKIGKYLSKEAAVQSDFVWFPYNKGGNFRKWYGNINHVINWYKDGSVIKDYKQKQRQNNPNYNVAIAALSSMFKSQISWSLVTSSTFSVRYYQEGFLFDVSGSSLIVDKKDDEYFLLGLLNSNISKRHLNILNPTINYQPGNIKDLIFIKAQEEEINELVSKSISISRADWDSFETSWDFKIHPLTACQDRAIPRRLQELFEHRSTFTKEKFNQIKAQEEEMNRRFLDIYGLQGEITPDVSDKEITLYIAERETEIKSFISYAIGCMFGRYSLDEEGLIYAGGEFDPNKYQKYQAVEDNILPIVQGLYFEDDIVSRFIDFIRVTFGEETLAENLDFIADALGKKKGEVAKETIRRYFLNDFFKDHIQTYKKRPIYWLFTSGKEKAFNCFIYLHRYEKTTISRIRTDYLHECQLRLDAEKKDLLSIIEGDYSTKEMSNAKKELKTLEKKIEELKEYDELLHHMADMKIELDLDDGVAVNYEKFKGLVAKI